MSTIPQLSERLKSNQYNRLFSCTDTILVAKCCINLYMLCFTRGCKTYIKTIMAREKETSPIKKQKLCSLKQRVRYHLCMVMASISDLWEEVFSCSLWKGSCLLERCDSRHDVWWRKGWWCICALSTIIQYHYIAQKNFIITWWNWMNALQQKEKCPCKIQRQKRAVIEKSPPTNRKSWMHS